MSKSTLLFDLDGTLYPSSVGTERAIIPALHQEVSSLLGMDRDKAVSLIRQLSRKYGYSVRGLIEENLVDDPHSLVERIYAHIDKTTIKPNRELIASFSKLHSRYKVIILTNSSRGHAEEVLTRLGVSDQVTQVFGIQDIGYRLKPDREVYLQVADDLDRDPIDFVYFDDSIRNIHAAWKMGARCILVSNGMVEPPYFWENHFKMKHLAPDHLESTFDLSCFLQETF